MRYPGRSVRDALQNRSQLAQPSIAANSSISAEAFYHHLAVRQKVTKSRHPPTETNPPGRPIRYPGKKPQKNQGRGSPQKNQGVPPPWSKAGAWGAPPALFYIYGCAGVPYGWGTCPCQRPPRLTAEKYGGLCPPRPILGTHQRAPLSSAESGRGHSTMEHPEC
jgi:hypothetical protein